MDRAFTGKREARDEGASRFRVEVDVIGLGALIENKKATGRAKDLADIEGFE